MENPADRQVGVLDGQGIALVLAWSRSLLLVGFVPQVDCGNFGRGSLDSACSWLCSVSSDLTRVVSRNLISRDGSGAWLCCGVHSQGRRGGLAWKLERASLLVVQARLAKGANSHNKAMHRSTRTALFEWLITAACPVMASVMRVMSLSCCDVDLLRRRVVMYSRDSSCWFVFNA